MNSRGQIASDLKILKELLIPRRSAVSHRAQLDSFYKPQAKHYDNFRDRLLQGRRELVEQLIPPGFSGVWIDIGGGTGRTIEFVAERITPQARVIVLDLCKPLLDIAKKRIAHAGWGFAETCHDDITSCAHFSNSADVVTLCYSLTMIPRWREALDAAHRILRPGARIGIVDFTCSGEATLRRRLWDLAWKGWFSYDGVQLSAQHHREARARFTAEHLGFSSSRIPYLLGARAPTYTFLGRRT